MSRYDDVPYVSLPILTTAPSRVLWTAFVHGGPRPRCERLRVLEIGCGDGANLLPIAFHHPDWACTGIDLSERAIEAARALAAQSQLRNVELHRADLADVPIAEGAWDLVIAHGIYSWIDEPRRASLRRTIRRALARSGLAVVSFNALPGWAVRGRVRDALVRTGSGLERARALLEELAPLTGDDVWGHLLAHEIERARDAADGYLTHEYLASDNDAFWVGDFASQMSADGLRWLGDSQFDLPQGRPFEALKTRLGETGMHAEELADLIGFRQLRSAVLARDDAPFEPAANDDELAGAVASGVLAATRDPFRLEPDVEETLRSPLGIEVRVRDPLSKMALLELARIYPDGRRLSDLPALAREAVERFGGDASASSDEGLRSGLLGLWREGALGCRLGALEIGTAPSARPVAPLFTRVEAEIRPCVTSALHVAIPLDPLERAIVRRLDGTLAAAAIARDLATRIADGRIELEGAPPGGVERVLPFVESAVERTIATLARWGLAG